MKSLDYGSGDFMGFELQWASNGPTFSNKLLLLEKGWAPIIPQCIFFFLITIGLSQYFTPTPLKLREDLCSPNMLVVLRKDYCETAKETPLIIVQLLLEHLPIPVIKKIIENCWRHSKPIMHAMRGGWMAALQTGIECVQEKRGFIRGKIQTIWFWCMMDLQGL